MESFQCMVLRDLTVVTARDTLKAIMARIVLAPIHRKDECSGVLKG